MYRHNRNSEEEISNEEFKLLSSVQKNNYERVPDDEDDEVVEEETEKEELYERDDYDEEDFDDEDDDL